MKTHPTPFELDQAELGLLSDERRRSLEEHLAGCARCSDAQQALHIAAQRFRTQVFPRTLERVQVAAARERQPLWRPWSLVAVPAAAALLLVAGVVGRPARHHVDEEPAVSIKGRPSLRVFVRRGERVQAAQDGAALAAGDALRFVVEPGRHRFLLVASVDGMGKVSVYHPFQGSGSAPLGAEPRVELPGSIVLDRAPGPERVFALFSDAPLDRATVSAALGRLGASGAARIRHTTEIPLAGTEQASFLFEKAEPAP
jgi:hypothetical protein